MSFQRNEKKNVYLWYMRPFRSSKICFLKYKLHSAPKLKKINANNKDNYLISCERGAIKTQMSP